jgi:hypothetical protein
MDKIWAMALAPFMLLLFLSIAYPIKKAIHRFMPDGRFKRLLFRRFG